MKKNNKKQDNNLFTKFNKHLQETLVYIYYILYMYILYTTKKLKTEIKQTAFPIKTF